MPPQRSDRIKLGSALLGAAVRARRESLGLTLQEASSSAGVSLTYLSDVERGRRLPSLDVLDKIGTGLKSTARGLLEDVFPWDDVPEPDAVHALDDGRRSRWRLAEGE